MAIIFHETGTLEQKLGDILKLINVDNYERQRIESFFDEIKEQFKIAENIEEEKEKSYEEGYEEGYEAGLEEC